MLVPRLPPPIRCDFRLCHDVISVTLIRCDFRLYDVISVTLIRCDFRLYDVISVTLIRCDFRLYDVISVTLIRYDAVDRTLTVRRHLVDSKTLLVLAVVWQVKRRSVDVLAVTCSLI